MMTEKDKMLSGQLYLAFDKQLVKERNFAKELLFDYNHTRPMNTSKKMEILNQLLGKKGSNILIEAPFYCDYGYNIEVGENFYANHNCVILDGAKVKIGNNVLLAPNVSIFTAGHPIDPKSRSEGWEYAYPITIGNNVWIGGNSVINPGVSIGNNVVIGSGSVVTKDIPDNTIAVGNPCRPIKSINHQ